LVTEMFAKVVKSSSSSLLSPSCEIVVRYTNRTCGVSITYHVRSCSLWTFFSLIVNDIFFANKVFCIADPLFLPVLLPEVLELEARVKH
jgi:hypothetical protein